MALFFSPLSNSQARATSPMAEYMFCRRESIRVCWRIWADKRRPFFGPATVPFWVNRHERKGKPSPGKKANMISQSVVPQFNVLFTWFVTSIVIAFVLE
jgi:hypothetical protein